MGSLVDIINALFSLDIGFLIDHVLTYIFWFFAFYAAAYIITDGKKPLLTTILYGTIILATSQFLFPLIGFSIYTAYGLMLLYLGRMAVLLFLENTKQLKQHIPLGYVLVFYLAIAVVAIGGI